jgi:hypothetical protein
MSSKTLIEQKILAQYKHFLKKNRNPSKNKNFEDILTEKDKALEKLDFIDNEDYQIDNNHLYNIDLISSAFHSSRIELESQLG